MNQLCRVCGEPAAGFHFGAFTCEGCKSFFGRTYNNLSQIHECKNGGSCVINKQNRTSCKACRLKKCVFVGMSKSGSRYGRRSNWFKIHCLLQEQAAQVNKSLEQGRTAQGSLGDSPPPMTSLTPPPITDLSPSGGGGDSKGDGQSLSSPESEVSDGIMDPHRPSPTTPLGFTHRDPLFRDRVPGREFVANLGLYSFHPGLSFLQASQFYSRLYPPSLYSPLPHPRLLPTPPTPTPPLRESPVHPPTYSPVRPTPENSPTPLPPTSPESPHHGSSSPFCSRKRAAESPISEVWSTPAPHDQEAPIDLRVKRRRLSTHGPHEAINSLPPMEGSDNVLPLLPLPSMTPAPVNLSSKA